MSKQVCGGCLQTKDNCPEQCPTRDESKAIYVDCWTSKGLGIRWRGEDGWKRLKCKGNCGLWAYSKPTNWVLSDADTSHGTGCIRPKRKRGAGKTSEISESIENEETTEGTEEGVEPIPNESTTSQEIQVLKEDVKEIKAQLQQILSLLSSKKENVEEQQEVEQQQEEEVEEDNEVVIPPQRKKRKKTTKPWKRF